MSIVFCWLKMIQNMKYYKCNLIPRGWNCTDTFQVSHSTPGPRVLPLPDSHKHESTRKERKYFTTLWLDLKFNGTLFIEKNLSNPSIRPFPHLACPFTSLVRRCTKFFLCVINVYTCSYFLYKYIWMQVFIHPIRYSKSHLVSWGWNRAHIEPPGMSLYQTETGICTE